MKNLLLTVGFIIALCCMSYAAFYALSRDPAEVRMAMKEGDSMKWLRAEFRLTEEQFEEIKRLHDDYYVECSVHCALIVEAREKGQSEETITRLEANCEQAIEVHCRTVAAAMSDEEGARYLELVLPQIAHYDHHQAPNLQVSR